jgi:hypothetical protein
MIGEFRMKQSISQIIFSSTKKVKIEDVWWIVLNGKEDMKLYKWYDNQSNQNWVITLYKKIYELFYDPTKKHKKAHRIERIVDFIYYEIINRFEIQKCIESCVKYNTRGFINLIKLVKGYKSGYAKKIEVRLESLIKKSQVISTIRGCYVDWQSLFSIVLENSSYDIILYIKKPLKTETIQENIPLHFKLFYPPQKKVKLQVLKPKIL